MEPAAKQVGQGVVDILSERKGLRDADSAPRREPSQQLRAGCSPLRSLDVLLFQGQFYLDIPYQYFSIFSS